MATFENTVLIARPIEDVFPFLSDLENIPKWNYAIVETRKISEGPVGVGTTYHQVRSVPSRSAERLEITTYNPPCDLEIRGQLGPFVSRLFYALDATTPEGTRVTNTVELEPHGPGRLLARVRRTTGPGRCGRQPQEAQGAAGGIAARAWGTERAGPPVLGLLLTVCSQTVRIHLDLPAHVRGKYAGHTYNGG